MNGTNAKERVAKGAALLDIAFPGWEEKLHPADLDVRNSHLCVGAQLTGSFFSAEFQDFLCKVVRDDRRIFIDEVGFDANDDLDADEIKNAWIDIVRERKAAKCQ